VRVLDWASLAQELAAGTAPVYVVGEVDAAGLELLRPLRGRVLLASPAQGLRRAGFLAELGWERLRSAPDDPSRLAPAYGGQLQGAEPLAATPAAPAVDAAATMTQTPSTDSPPTAPATDTAPDVTHE
jgi:hypothetical protein